MNIKQFAKWKGCSRQNIYNAEKRGEVEIDRTKGFPVIFLNKNNTNWKPKGRGRQTIYEVKI